MAKSHKGRGFPPRGMRLADVLAQERLVRQACREAAEDAAVQVKADIHTQRAMWLMCVAMNDAFGIGPERFKQFAACLQDRSDWYEDLKNGADEEYANEKLRQEASRCSGTEIAYLYEAEMRSAGEVVG